MRFAIVSLLGFSLSWCALAQPVEDFDGFKWGASLNDVVQVRGKPDMLDGEVIWFYNNNPDIAGYKIGITGFEFKKGCSLLKESLTQPCELWNGYYHLASKEVKDYEAILAMLTSKHGAYTETVESTPIKSKNKENLNALLVNITKTIHFFKQIDGSSIVLEKTEYDRDYTAKISNVKSIERKKGIDSISIYFQSPEYNANKERKKPSANKSF